MTINGWIGQHSRVVIVGSKEYLALAKQMGTSTESADLERTISGSHLASNISKRTWAVCCSRATTVTYARTHTLGGFAQTQQDVLAAPVADRSRTVQLVDGQKSVDGLVSRSAELVGSTMRSSKPWTPSPETSTP